MARVTLKSMNDLLPAANDGLDAGGTPPIDPGQVDISIVQDDDQHFVQLLIPVPASHPILHLPVSDERAAEMLADRQRGDNGDAYCPKRTLLSVGVLKTVTERDPKTGQWEPVTRGKSKWNRRELKPGEAACRLHEDIPALLSVSLVAAPRPPKDSDGDNGDAATGPAAESSDGAELFKP